MAEIRKGILGGFSGKVGTVIGANWRGKDIIRSLPKPYSGLPSDKQEEQRAKFAVVSKFLQPLNGILARYFGEGSGARSRMNLAVSYHISNAVDYTDGTAAMVYSKVLITKGELSGFVGLSATAGAGQALQLQWTDNAALGNAKATDTLLSVVYNPASNLYVLFEAAATRADASALLQLPAQFEGDEVDCWAAFTRAKSSMASTSAYLGRLLVT